MTGKLDSGPMIEALRRDRCAAGASAVAPAPGSANQLILQRMHFGERGNSLEPQ